MQIIADFSVQQFSYRPLSAIAFALILSILVSGCSTQPTVSKPSQAIQTPISTVEAETLSAKQYIRKAKRASAEQAIELLIQASNSYLLEQKAAQAVWLNQQLSQMSLTIKQRYQIALIQAQAWLALADLEQAYQQISIAKQLQQESGLAHNQAYYQLTAMIQQQRQASTDAAAAQLNAFALNPQADIDAVAFIWQNLTQLAPWQLEQLSSRELPYFNGWQQLLNYASKFGHNNQQFHRYLNQWRNQFPSHPAQSLISSLELAHSPSADDVGANLDDSGTIQATENIAVLLPLSGKQSLAGNAAQQGILATYQKHSNIKLHFIDTEQSDFNQLASQFVELDINYVIGPLLKQNVDRYLAHAELVTPTLLLNLPSKMELLPHQVALSMRPEDEAVQAASVLSQKSYQHPLILAQQDNVSQRIANTFAKQWQLLTGQQPEQLSFNSDGQMKANLEQSLEVDGSNQRIKLLKRRIKEKLHTEERNRRDIDMIYLVGSHQATRLMKPYIDVNIAPFAKLIPVYASSRSHSIKIDADSRRDLYGLTFNDMPWRLDSTQQDKQLRQLSQTLWPERSDSLNTIFAMGYDSLTLINKLERMKQFHYIRHFGQTGILSLGDNNILTRSLLWGRYDRNKVKQTQITKN